MSAKQKVKKTKPTKQNKDESFCAITIYLLVTKNELDFMPDTEASRTNWNQLQNSNFKEVSISPKWRDLPCLIAKYLVLVIEKDIPYHYGKHSHWCNSGKWNFHIFKVISTSHKECQVQVYWDTRQNKWQIPLKVIERVQALKEFACWASCRN